MDSKLTELWGAIGGLRARRRGANAGEFQGRPVSTDAPADNAVLAWDATNKKWRPLPALTRKMPMSVMTASNSHVGTDDITLADGVTNAFRVGCPVPSDWVSGTDITVNCYLLQLATAGSPWAVLRSYISVLADQGTFTWDFENGANMNAQLTQNLNEKQSRTVTAASISSGDYIYWAMFRLGGDGGDAVNAAVKVIGAIWIEYTAQF